MLVLSFGHGLSVKIFFNIYRFVARNLFKGQIERCRPRMVSAWIIINIWESKYKEIQLTDRMVDDQKTRKIQWDVGLEIWNTSVVF